MRVLPAKMIRTEFSLPLVLHDAFLFPGGGERLALELAGMFDAELLTGESMALPADFARRPVRTLPPAQRIWGFSKTVRGIMTFRRMPEQIRPLTIFSGQISFLGHDRVRGPKMLYCHTPPRILYDRQEAFLAGGGKTRRAARRALLFWYSALVKRAVTAMDVIVANSITVRERIARYWGISDCPVVYPPCGEGFHWKTDGDAFVSFARLDRLKRVDVLIKAFHAMPEKQLTVVGAGPEESRLRDLAGNAPNIAFTGQLSDAALRDVVGTCLATLYTPVDEDFGISPVESMAAGKPVVGVNAGGLRETILNGETGFLLPEPLNVEDVIALISALRPETLRAMRPACERQARRFDSAAFRHAMRKAATDKRLRGPPCTDLFRPTPALHISYSDFILKKETL